MIRKGIAAMLCLSMLTPLFSACNGSNERSENNTPKFYYDDRISYTDLGGTDTSSVTILEQQITSKKVGSQESDTAVLYFDDANKQFIAVGTGTANLDIDGKKVSITVEAAPISLFMITGHSLGAGQCGVAAKSIVSEAGQVYSSYKTATFQEATADMGIGYTSSVKPQGIDAFAPNGGGTIGEGSGIAYKWNQLTGEKVWVLNAAVGGSVITEWYQEQKFYVPAVAMYRAAAQVLANEVAAGHYILKNTAIIYHSGANFGYKNVVYTEETLKQWYDSMLEGFKKDLAFDINGDGTPETVERIAFLPSGYRNMNHDKPITFYLAALDAYPDSFIIAETIANWNTDELLKANFPQINYTTQSEPAQMPTKAAELYAKDGVHFSQEAYNAAGLEIGQNLYNYFRTEVQLESLSILTAEGAPIREKLRFKHVGDSQTLIIQAKPCYYSNFTIAVSDNLEVTSPFAVTAKAAGEGFITVSKDGQVVRQITVTIEE